METLFLIDANSIIHRCFHAMPPLTATDGRPIQAVYGLANILLKVFREEKPEYIAALFDRPEPTFREKIYPAYKAQRPPTHADLVAQIIEAHTLFQKFGICTFEQPGFEADDLVASLAKKFRDEEDLIIVILTGDLDALQLVRAKKVIVRVFQRGISETTLYDEDSVHKRYGLKPEQLTDYKALVGDQSDNLKGVPGIGPKTASELLQRFGTLESLYENLEKIPKKIAQKLGVNKHEAELSKKMVTPGDQLETGISNLAELRRRDTVSELAAYFRELGFETLLKRLEDGTIAGSAPRHSQGNIFS